MMWIAYTDVETAELISIIDSRNIVQYAEGWRSGMRLIDADALIKDIDGDLLDGIAEARAIEKIENAPTVGNWISVKDRLPEATQPSVKGEIVFSDYVLTCLRYENGSIWITVDTCRVDHGIWLHEVPGEGCKVTHWMPLPEPPKEEEHAQYHGRYQAEMV